MPIYLLHRYQTEAASKVLGGLYYTYAIRGDDQKITERIPGAEQRRALEALLKTIDPSALTLAPNILALIPPRAEGYYRTREDFHNRTGLTFDPIGAAESAASLTVGLILNPQRAARLVQYHAEDPASPGLGEVIDRLIAVTLRARLGDGPAGEVQRATSAVVLYDLMMLAANENTPAEVRAIAMSKLTALSEWAVIDLNDGVSARAFISWAAAQVKRFELNPKDIGIPKPPEAPPGQPIGCESN